MTDDHVIGRGDAVDRLFETKNEDDQVPTVPRTHVWEYRDMRGEPTLHRATDAEHLDEECWIECHESDLIVDPDAEVA